MARSKCLYCSSEMNLDQSDITEIGEIIECENCSAEMEIVQCAPLKIKRPE